MTVACWQQKVRLMKSFIFETPNLPGHSLELGSLTVIKTVQPFGQIVQLIKIDQ